MQPRKSKEQNNQPLNSKDAIHSLHVKQQNMDADAIYNKQQRQGGGANNIISQPSPSQTITEQQQEFNLDRQEYHSVFKVFDKDNTGEIKIQQVYDLINKFEVGMNNNAQAKIGTKPNEMISGPGQQTHQLKQSKTSGSNNNQSNYGMNSNYYKQRSFGDQKSHNSGIGPYSSNKAAGSQKQSLINGNYQGSKDGQRKNTVDMQNASYHQSHHSRHYQKMPGGSMSGHQAFNQTAEKESNKYSPNRKNGYLNNTNNNQSQQTNAIGNQSSNISNTGIIQLKPTQLNYGGIPKGDSPTKSPRRQTYHYQIGKTDQQKQNIKLYSIGPGTSQPTNISSASHQHTGGGQNEDNICSKSSEEQIITDCTTNEQEVIQAKSHIGKNAGQQSSQQQHQQQIMEFPNGKDTLKFEEFINIIRDSCQDSESAENYLVLAFSMFDRQKKGFISTDDLKEVFELLGESITDEEVNTMIKIAGIKSNDKINFKEFVDFFYKID